jgi:hypothetical protein
MLKKGFIPFFLILAFSGYFSPGRLCYGEVKPLPNLSSCQDYAFIFMALSNTEAPNKWEISSNQLIPLTHKSSIQELSRPSSLPDHWLLPSSSKHYHWLGMGCGGLPS